MRQIGGHLAVPGWAVSINLELCTVVVPVVPGGSSGLSDWLLARGLIE